MTARKEDVKLKPKLKLRLRLKLRLQEQEFRPKRRLSAGKSRPAGNALTKTVNTVTWPVISMKIGSTLAGKRRLTIRAVLRTSLSRKKTTGTGIRPQDFSSRRPSSC